MSTFELGMSLDYCHNWGVREAVREIFQNAIDAETANPDNKMSWSYDGNTLRVANEHGKLNVNSLLLGVSSKRGDDKTIGQYGEGYKIAIVVLKRLGKGVRVFNRGNRETWEARTVKSRRYNENVVVVDVKKQLFAEPDADLVFEVSDISPSEFEELSDSNLHIAGVNEDEYIQSDVGRILTSERFASRIYVGGLYVTTSRNLIYGYDFNPDVLRLERDRSLVDGFDLQFACGKAIVGTRDVEFITKAADTWDGSYIHFYVPQMAQSGEVYDRLYTKFIKEHGKDAIPVTSTEDFNRLASLGYNPVLIRENSAELIKRSEMYAERNIDVETENEALARQLRDWFNKYIDFGTDAYYEGHELVNSICEVLQDG